MRDAHRPMDLVARLRSDEVELSDELCQEAADEIKRLCSREDAHHLEMAKLMGELAALRAERDAWALKVSQMRGSASNCLAMKPTSGNMRHALEGLAGDEAAPPDSASPEQR